jgi:hypothetical protein
MYKKYEEDEGGLARSGYKLSIVLRDMGFIAEADACRDRAAALRKKILGLESWQRGDESGYDDLIMLVDH